MSSKSYHINSYGVVGVCEAVNGNCPFGGESGKEFHFNTKEEAIKYAEINSEIFAMADSEPSSEVVQRGSNDPNNGYGELLEHYKRARKSLKNINKGINKLWQLNNKEGKPTDYMNNEMRRKKSNADRRYNKILNDIRNMEGRRAYAENFKKLLPEGAIVHEATSSKSCSKYIQIKSSYYNDVADLLRKEGLKFEEREDAKEHLGDYFEIRFSNHYPPEYQVDKKNYWLDDSRPCFLIDYPKVEEVNFSKIREKGQSKEEFILDYLNKRKRIKFWNKLKEKENQ